MTHHEFQSVVGDEVVGFSQQVATELRRIADRLDKGEGFVVLAIASCDYDSTGGPFVLVDRDAATVELIDEMSDSIKNALFEGLE